MSAPDYYGDTILVGCPLCHALPGQRCQVVNPRWTGHPWRDTPHAERERVANLAVEMAAARSCSIEQARAEIHYTMHRDAQLRALAMNTPAFRQTIDDTADSLHGQMRTLNRAMSELGALLVATLVLAAASVVAAVRRLRNR